MCAKLKQISTCLSYISQLLDLVNKFKNLDVERTPDH
jgi:hypothetical protein